MFESFKSEILSSLEIKIEVQDKNIVELESKLAVHENVMDKLMIKCDDSEQYSRRSCRRII